ncbi:hypothetical protein [Mycobacteroides abscessus]|nr:hypothetical protein [Mycobacteroides abscessus]DAZ90327.1 TPA_asm: hypothetical protein PROPHIFSQJ01-1_41 [Mycobacterium phage prophiFSQJ01-1]SII40916.1 Uncharacterised protein [Mycobacteroides abscessus subsp. abscessus]SIK14295.1 Uncharacterised protein [Mycobacteroides abscessus subsp. abscessus]SIN25331.1 Uncharacterised protein [Mycobacteroides abscessus subsp. abscessus]SLI51592.1 Uncharacterised protein [Mycobacteroides abscessus subsp. abscessus]
MIGVTFGAQEPGWCHLCGKTYPRDARVTYRSHDEEPVHLECAELIDGR